MRPIRLPNRWKTVPLPTPAAAATCSIEMSRGRRVASSASVAAKIARRLRAASARSGRAWLMFPSLDNWTGGPVRSDAS